MSKFGVITQESIFIPGDERSRTNPGHGYPDHTERYQKLHEFDVEEQVIEFIRRNQTRVVKVIKFDVFVVETTLRLVEKK
jgi:type IV secretory pathway ATPase VirB11/archaellum biosynthesis ATPase